MHTLHNFTKKIVRAGYVDGYLVEFFPFVKHLPVPLAPWKKEAMEWAPRFSKLFSGLYGDVKTRVVCFPHKNAKHMFAHDVDVTVGWRYSSEFLGVYGRKADQVRSQ